MHLRDSRLYALGIPHTSLEVEVVHRSRQVPRSLQFGLDERLIDDHFRGVIAEFAVLPRLDLLSHGLEVPLHPVDTDRDAINER